MRNTKWNHGILLSSMVKSQTTLVVYPKKKNRNTNLRKVKTKNQSGNRFCVASPCRCHAQHVVFGFCQCQIGTKCSWYSHSCEKMPDMPKRSKSGWCCCPELWKNGNCNSSPQDWTKYLSTHGWNCCCSPKIKLKSQTLQQMPLRGISNIALEGKKTPTGGCCNRLSSKTVCSLLSRVLSCLYAR